MCSITQLCLQCSSFASFTILLVSKPLKPVRLWTPCRVVSINCHLLTFLYFGYNMEHPHTITFSLLINVGPSCIQGYTLVASSSHGEPALTFLFPQGRLMLIARWSPYPSVNGLNAVSQPWLTPVLLVLLSVTSIHFTGISPVPTFISLMCILPVLYIRVYLSSARCSSI